MTTDDPSPVPGTPTDPTMRYFLDCEFIEDGRTIDLLSIGITCEDGREYYAENGEADLTRANDWVKANVLPHLKGGGIRRWRIGSEILQFVGVDTPEFWADYGAYDWVALCQIYGPMIELPRGWPMFCLDIQQYAKRLGVTDFPMSEDEHNALEGARVCRHRFIYLTALERDRA